MNYGDLYAGVGSVDITPPVGAELSGFAARVECSKGVYDRLKAKAVVISDVQQKVVIITSDIIGYTPQFVNQIRSIIAKHTDILANNIMVTASHTHSGPETGVLKYLAKVDKKYINELKEKLVRLVVKANKKLIPVIVLSGKGESDISFNRTDKITGIVDKELKVIVLRNKLKKTNLAVITNFSCHPVILDAKNYYISADYPGVMQRVVESKLKGTTMFINGTCGDINPLLGHKWRKEMIETGRQFAKDVLYSIKTIKPNKQNKLQIKSKTIKIPFQPPEPMDKLEELKTKYFAEMIATKKDKTKTLAQKKGAATMYHWISDKTTKISRGAYPKYLELEIQVLQLGKIIIVALPGEVFTEIGMKLKTSWRNYEVLIAGYGNGDIGYIPTKKAYQKWSYATHCAPMYYGFPIFKDSVEDIIVTASSKLVSDIINN